MDSHKTFYPAGTEIGQYQDYPGINFAVWVNARYKENVTRVIKMAVIIIHNTT